MSEFRRRVIGAEVQSHGGSWIGDTSTARSVEAADGGPRFTVVVPVWNTDPDALRAMFASVVAQRYEGWDISLADDGSDDPSTIEALKEIAAHPRVHVTRLPANSGIVSATNAALAESDNEWIAFVDHDDQLHPNALLDVARLVREVPDLGFVYTDQDRLRTDGTVGDPSFKSAWSPDLLRSTNCIVHLCCYRRDVFDAVGGLREGFDGSQDYDLLLRVSDALDVARIGHVARPRYHWRASPDSVAADPTAKPWAYEAARNALVDSLTRRGRRGRVEPHQVLGWYDTRYELDRPLRATVFVIGSNGSGFERTRTSIASTAGRVHVVEIVQSPSERAAAAAAASVGTELAVFVAAGVVVDPTAIDGLAEHAQRDDVAVAGGVVTDANGVRSFGLVIDEAATITPATPAIAPADYSWSGRVVRNLSSVTFQLAAIRPEIIRTLGSDPALDGDLFAADLCLRARSKGSCVVSTPHATGLVDAAPLRRMSSDAVRRFRSTWGLDAGAGDPFLNPNLATPAASPREGRGGLARGVRASLRRLTHPRRGS